MVAKNPLTGVSVLDLTRLVPGGYGTQLLGDLGAEVIKVEQPDGGDYMREFEPHLDDGTGYAFAMLNRNKKSVVLDLKKPAGKEVFYDMVTDADAIVEGFRPGVVDRLDVDYETVKEHNENIVYCSLSGYGQDGPARNRVGHDLNYIARAGILDLTGDSDGPPTIPGIQIADHAGGFMAAICILAGLLKARNSSEGMFFDVSMTDVSVSLLTFFAPFSLQDRFSTPSRGDVLPNGGYPCYDVYETADGEYITIAAVEFKFWLNLCRALDLPEYANRDDHYPEGQRNDRVRRVIAQEFQEENVDYWERVLTDHDVPFDKVNNLDEVWDDPQIVAREMITELPGDDEYPVINFPAKTSEDLSWVREGYPELGEDTFEVLARLGLPEQELNDLEESGVIDTDR